jgi:hypothetical protein
VYSLDVSQTARSVAAQQDFLRATMKQLGLSRDGLARRIGATRRRVDSWLLPSASAGHRELDGVVWSYLREILAWEDIRQRIEVEAAKRA